VSAASFHGIGRAAAALASAPSDYDTWLYLAGLLAAAGRRAEAESAFVDLGRAACLGGQVALAVACARWLEQRGAAPARELIDEIVELHALGSTRIDPAARPNPPPTVPPPLQQTLPASLEAAIGLSTKAIAHALEVAIARAPDKFPPTPLVSTLPPEDVRTLIETVTLQPVSAGQAVVQTGEPATHLYWIARGSVRITRGDTVLGELVSGAFFGEIAIMAAPGGVGVRTATATCTLDTWLLTIPASDVEAMAARQPRLAKALALHARSRLLSNVMRTSELFARLGDDDKSELLGRFETVMIGVGESFISAGQDNDHLWVVVTGECEVRVGETVIATLGPGDGVGEISLLEKKPATKDVVATKPTALLRLARSEFDEIAVKYPELLAEVYKLLVEREQANQRLVLDANDLIV
jgi:CRP-like cAMP-binding protein